MAVTTVREFSYPLESVLLEPMKTSEKGIGDRHVAE